MSSLAAILVLQTLVTQGIAGRNVPGPANGWSRLSRDVGAGGDWVFCMDDSFVQGCPTKTGATTTTGKPKDSSEKNTRACPASGFKRACGSPAKLGPVYCS